MFVADKSLEYVSKTQQQVSCVYYVPQLTLFFCGATNHCEVTTGLSTMVLKAHVWLFALSSMFFAANMGTRKNITQ